MDAINLADAKAHLSELIDRVEVDRHYASWQDGPAARCRDSTAQADRSGAAAIADVGDAAPAPEHRRVRAVDRDDDRY